MQVMKWSVMALAVAAATSQMAYATEQDDSTTNVMPVEEVSSQAASNGFLEDADLQLKNRNFAFYRNNKGNAPDEQNYRNEWAHGFMTTFTSGFTQGIVGFGVDAFGQVGLQLNSGQGQGGTGLLPVNNSKSNEGQSEYGLAGGAVKARVSESVLAFGQQRPASPVFATPDSRLLPAWATGTSFASDEITDLHIQGGHFYSGSASNGTNQDGELQTTYGETPFNTADYIGGDYTFNDNLGIGLHAAKYDDLWNQYYADLYHTWDMGDEMSLSTSLNYYHTQDTGNANAGDISTNAYSGSLAFAIGAQTFTIAHQGVNGDTPFDYVSIDGSAGDSIWLANSLQYSDFNGPGEKSYQARYDLDMTTLGVPGLSFMARYVTGGQANGTGADCSSKGAYCGAMGHSGDEWERDLEVKYVIQEGAAKDLSFRVRQATWRSNQDFDSGYFGSNGANAVDEIRIITEYPLDIL
ncbi:imipenem/basic amino acid-specific outer membrane pore [Pseudomonas pohangensis]|uniref:Imipenem/basic amino acid-specific outer membrane pore n=1 Tax=Pseudomonas pohangensis TaxID=364197 RepID=A0A1H2G4N5_9PSED|nr:OprD family porin [Pseudomonas pohangensis]SDU14537.1 imipenem/basic amino acid-specific outer membrane pore [Pseudomonas pohangensis]